MDDSGTKRVLLDPRDLDTTLREFQLLFDLTPTELSAVRKVVALLPRPAQLYYDDTILTAADLPLVDKFTFDVETDELVVFACDSETLIDAIIEMAMYLSGFTTKLGNPETWVIEFTIGAWRTVRQRIRRQLSLPTSDQPIGIIGLPSSPENTSPDTGHLFQQLVAHFDKASFHQMIVLAARDNILVQFPAETHPKVRALYIHARRAIQEIGQGLTLGDHRIFNRLLNDAIQRIEQLFAPDTLESPAWLLNEAPPSPQETSPYSSPSTPTSDASTQDSSRHPTPFEAFVDQLFPDEDDDLDDSSII